MKHKLLITFLSFPALLGLPAPIYYQASELNPEPWYERSWLSSITLKGRTAIVDSGYNACGEKTEIFGIYGTDNVQYLTENVPSFVVSRTTSYLTTLPTLRGTSKNFGAMPINAQLIISNWSLELTQNFCHGLYAQAVIPFRRISVHNVHAYNETTQSEGGPSIDWSTFQTLRNNFISTFAAYGTCLRNGTVQHLSDIQLLLGWTRNDDSTYYLDYVDYSLISGIYAPTSTQVNPANPLQLSTGYDKHLSVPFMANCSIGACNWITIHTYLGAIVITQKKSPMGFMTSLRQNGWVRLTHGCALVKPGTIVQLGGTLKADHVIHGLSLALGVGYDHQDRTTIYPCDLTIDTSIANADPKLQSWSMLTLHLHGSYDYANYHRPHAPLVTLSADLPVRGKRIFKTDMIGATMQLIVSYSW